MRPINFTEAQDAALKAQLGLLAAVDLPRDALCAFEHEGQVYLVEPAWGGGYQVTAYDPPRED